MAYVTPWNARGYEEAAQWCGQLNIISPAWLYMLRAGNAFEVERRNVNETFLAELEGCGASVVPRLSLVVADTADVALLFDTADAVAAAMVDAARDFDGLVLETPLTGVESFKAPLYALVDRVARALEREGRFLVLVVPPARPGLSFTRRDMDMLPAVSFFNVMAYDFRGDRAAPVAPVTWVEDVLTALGPPAAAAAPEAPGAGYGRVLLGLNFYGYIYRVRAGDLRDVLAPPEPILRADFDALAQMFALAPRLDPGGARYWEFENSAGDTFAVFMPDREEILEKLERFAPRGCGFSVWELGQGGSELAELYANFPRVHENLAQSK